MELVERASDLCQDLAKQYSRAAFFAGNLIFQREHWFRRLLHDATANAIQLRLQWDGLPMVVLPVLAQEG